MRWKCPKFGFLAILRWKLKYLSFRTPKGTSLWQNTCLDVSLAKIGPRVWPGRVPVEHKNNGVGGHLGFSTFLIFEHRALLGVRLRLCLPNFVTIGLTVQKLLTFLVFHRKCIESAPKLGFLAILGVKTEIFIFLNPQKAPPCAKTRVLTYHSPKSAHWFDQGAIPRNIQNNGVGGHLGFSNFRFLTILHFCTFGDPHRTLRAKFHSDRT